MTTTKAITKTAVALAVRAAVKASIAAKGASMPVALPQWEGYRVRASKRYGKHAMHPTTHIEVYHSRTHCTVWQVTAGELAGALGLVGKRIAEMGFHGPVTSDWLPVDYVTLSKVPCGMGGCTSVRTAEGDDGLERCVACGSH